MGVVAYIGKTRDDGLTWKEHINKIKSKVIKTVGAPRFDGLPHKAAK